MDPKAFERTLRARAFDVTRGILPLATITSLGQVVSARVLERQISRLLSDILPEAHSGARPATAVRRSCTPRGMACAAPRRGRWPGSVSQPSCSWACPGSPAGRWRYRSS